MIFHDTDYPGIKTFLKEYKIFEKFRRDMGEPTPTFEFYMYRRFKRLDFLDKRINEERKSEINQPQKSQI